MGKLIYHENYCLVYRPDHPNAQTNGCIPIHRLIYEHYLKILFDEDIYIPREIEIHHINENTLDNSLINLLPLNKSGHTTTHNLIDMSDRRCVKCNGNKTHMRKTKIGKRPNWFGNKDYGWICSYCYDKMRGSRKTRRKVILDINHSC